MSLIDKIKELFGSASEQIQNATDSVQNMTDNESAAEKNEDADLGEKIQNVVDDVKGKFSQ